MAGNGDSDSVNTDEDGYYEFDDVPAGGLYGYIHEDGV